MTHWSQFTSSPKSLKQSSLFARRVKFSHQAILLLIAVLSSVIFLPAHSAQESCNPENITFKEWCKANYQFYFSNGFFFDISLGTNSCTQACRDVDAFGNEERKQLFEQGCVAHGGKVHSLQSTWKWDYGCVFYKNQAQKSPPQANFTYSPSEGYATLTVGADGNSSTDSDGSITNYQWSTSDGKTATGSTASFVFDKAGTYTITLTVTDNDSLTGSTQHSVTVKESKVEVVSVTSKYPSKTHFLDGLDHEVTYTAEIDWGGGEPGTVSFISPNDTKNVTATGNTAEQSFNMGKDFGTCGKLKVVATSKDGKNKSTEKEADFVIMSDPILPPGIDFQRVGDGNSFHYSLGTLGINWTFVDDVFGPAGTSDPIFGKYVLGMKFIPTVGIEINSEGETEVSMDWEGASKTIAEGKDGKNLFKVGDFSIELHPMVKVKGTFQQSSCSWQWGGNVGLSGGGSLSIPPFQFVVPVGPVPVPMYSKWTFGVSASGAFAIEKIEPLTPNGGTITVSPFARGSLGVGVSDVLAGEGWLQGSGELEWEGKKVPLEQTRGAVVGKIGAAVVVLTWKWEGEALSCEWDFVTSAGKCTSPFIRSALRQPTLIERDYLNNPDHGKFTRSTRRLRDSTTNTIPLQQSTYPYSDADLSGNDKTLYAVWVADNPSRSSINRTQTVFTTWNGSEWSELQPIADDGTADFHPNVLAFADNQAVATWEDTKQVLTDAAKFEDSISNLEISVGNYNPQTQQWTTQRLTDNSYLDRSPKLSGINGNAIVTWISNESNDLMGSATNPNKLWFAQFNNGKWSTPQLIANIPNPLLKYNTIYNGQTGHVVLSMDTDGDLTTIEDHELFQTTFNNGTWSPLTRLTTDTVSDDNPQLAIAPNGILLTWFKGAEISSVVNFDFNTRTVLKKDDTGYSSNLADFKLATSPTGKLAALWAEPSVENSSDVYALFYDSTTNQWGNSKQLTFDPQTERRIAATFVGNDVIALYNRGQVGNSATTTSNGNVPVASNTDLYMLKHSVRSVDFTNVNLPELGKALAFNLQGTPANVDARFVGGITTDGKVYSRNQLSTLSEYITISGAITSSPEHVGQTADIVAAGFYVREGFLKKADEASAENCDPALVDSVAKGGYYMMKQAGDQYCSWVMTNGTEADKNWCVSETDKNSVLRKRPETSSDYFSLWDGNLQSLPAINKVTLKDFQEIPVLYKGRFDAPGHVCFYFGYRLPDGTLVFNGEQTINVRIKP